MLELLTTIARTLYRLDVKAAHGLTLGEGDPELGWGRRDRKQFQLYDAYISMRDGPMVQFKEEGCLTCDWITGMRSLATLDPL